MAIAKEKYRDIHREAVERFDAARNTVIEQRSRQNEDMRMLYVEGGQWEGSLFNGVNINEAFEGKPRFEINKLRKEHSRIKSEFRTNRVNVRFLPKGSDDEGMADSWNGLWRTAYEETDGQEAFDNAFDWASGCGFGCFKMSLVQEDEDDPESDVKVAVEPVYDPVKSAWFDPNSKKYDKSDAMYAFEIVGITYDRYNELFNPDGNETLTPTSFKHGIKLLNYDYDYDWYGPDYVYVANYYKRVIKKKKYVIMENPLLKDRVEMPVTSKEAVQNAIDEGYIEVRTYSKKEMVCEHYIVDGINVIEKEDNIPGGAIPLIPVYGHRTFIDDIERADGLVSPAKDAQRLYNMQASVLADVASHTTDNTPILDPEEVRGLEPHWQNRHINRAAYLPKYMLKDEEGRQIPKPTEYLQNPDVPPALAAMMDLMGAEIRSMLGEEAERLPANTSAEAIAQIADRVDMQSYLYISNFAKSIKRAAKVFYLMNREISIDEREFRLTDNDGSQSVVEFNKPNVDELGNDTIENDIKSGSFDVAVEVGPTFSSKRESTISTLNGLLPNLTPDNPYYVPVMSMYIENLDGENLQQLKEFNRNIQLQNGLVQPKTEKEEQMLQQMALQAQQPDPNAEAQRAFLESEALKNTSQAQKDKAQAFKTQADATRSLAETAKIAEEINNPQLEDEASQAAALSLIHISEPTRPY